MTRAATHIKEEAEAEGILAAEFDPANPADSLQRLFELTCVSLANFIKYYQPYTKWLKRLSVLTRMIAVLFGIIGLLLLNPLALTLVSDDISSVLSKPNTVYWAGIVAILAGGALTTDFAFGFTRKHTNWNVTIFELLAEKAEFHAAFSGRFLSKHGVELTRDLFEEARKLSLDTVHEFSVKRAEETKLWAQNLQTVMQSLRQSNQALQTSAQSAASAARKKHEEEIVAAEKTRKEEEAAKAAAMQPSGLTIKIKTDAARSKSLKLLISEILDDGNEKQCFESEVIPGGAVSKFLPKGRYTAKLLDNTSGATVGARAVTLKEDIEINI